MQGEFTVARERESPLTDNRVACFFPLRACNHVASSEQVFSCDIQGHFHRRCSPSCITPWDNGICFRHRLQTISRLGLRRGKSFKIFTLSVL